MSEEKHIIWSNIDLDLDDWYDDLYEEYPALGEEGLAGFHRAWLSILSSVDPACLSVHGI